MKAVLSVRRERERRNERANERCAVRDYHSAAAVDAVVFLFPLSSFHFAFNIGCPLARLGSRMLKCMGEVVCGCAIAAR